MLFPGSTSSRLLSWGGRTHLHTSTWSSRHCAARRWRSFWTTRRARASPTGRTGLTPPLRNSCRWQNSATASSTNWEEWGLRGRYTSLLGLDIDVVASGMLRSGAVSFVHPRNAVEYGPHMSVGKMEFRSSWNLSRKVRSRRMRGTSVLTC